ncbi:MAG: M50 family metallopeptidase [Actinomycetota bacterium]|nr:M50 family metallopeptidase [Actinomycetota bacterium]
MSPKWFEQEIVSGGTQPAEVPAKAERSTMIIGTVAWLALFVALGMWRPWSLVFVFGLAVSIMLHELGHFWTARRSGMKATQFFLGFGSRVWSTHRNGVEYGLRAIPLGGFVKIIGMTNVDEVPAEDEAYTYRQGSYARRMWVITAGSVMHGIIAIVLVTSVYAVAGDLQEAGRVTVFGVEADSPADLAGLEPHDVVVAVADTPVATSDEFRTLLAATEPGTLIDLTVQRGGETVHLKATLVQNPSIEGEAKGYLGVRSSSMERVPMSFGSALIEGPKDLFVGLGDTAVAIAKIMNPVNVYGHLTGSNTDPSTKPGTIVGATSISADVGEYDGWAGMLLFLAGINLSVGVLNMFPLMPLDGGHAAIATYERLRSRRGRRYYADINKLMPVAAVCIAIIAFMFLTGLYLDILKN